MTTNNEIKQTLDRTTASLDRSETLLTTTDDVLRALLADATARAEVAERTLAEALAKLPQTWGPPEVLHHLLEKAGRCDLAETRAEHAERTLAEWSGEDDNSDDEIRRAQILLSRTDLGAGMVVVGREVVERVRNVLTELAPTCRCDEAWTSRGRHEVNALCHMTDDAKAAIADLDAMLKKGGG